MRRIHLIVSVTALAVAAILFFHRTSPADQPKSSTNDSAPAKSLQLPIGQVVLFSSGVGYFQREGTVEDNARVDLSFPVTDINDLLKSMVMRDLDGGTISAVSYDSNAPVERTLKSFAINLNANPSFGQILTQARGEKVEVVLQQGNAAQPGTLSGTVIGIEKQKQAVAKDTIEVEVLNLWCSDGVRSLKLNEVQRVRFLNPVVNSEFKKALETLALSHDTQKKTVSINFAGEGKRQVRVGYVIENPIWKTSYRLVLDRKEKPYLQGWAIVENPTDEDWKDVRMALVSGRPISFQMDLYTPLFVPRPTVEPELFASLRPVAYSGDLQEDSLGVQKRNPKRDGEDFNLQTYWDQSRMPPADISKRGGTRWAEIGKRKSDKDKEIERRLNTPVNLNFTDTPLRQVIDDLRNWKGINIWVDDAALKEEGISVDRPVNIRVEQISLKSALKLLLRDAHLTYLIKDEVLQITTEKQANGKLAQGISPVASAGKLGESFQYAIDKPVSLPRQKSAMLPIVGKDVEGTRVSIYNERTQAKFPLLGLKLKNTSGLHLSQGPITVFEGSNYAGDSRILDLQPDEERLISFAIDLGTEVNAVPSSDNGRITAVKAVKGVVYTTTKVKETKNYTIKNRNHAERLVLIKHPVRNDFKLVQTDKPAETASDCYRFQVRVGPGKSKTQTVTEERVLNEDVAITNINDDTVRYLVRQTVTSPKVKAGLNKAMQLRLALAKTQREIAELERQQKAIVDDQVRLRANLKEMPPTADAYKRYLKKFDEQETQIEKYQADVKKLQATEFAQKRELDEFLASFSAE